MKHFMGLGKRSHHSNLLAALTLPRVEEILKRQSHSLFYKIFQVDSPLRDIMVTLVSRYIASSGVYRGNLVSRLVNFGLSPVKCAFVPPHRAATAGRQCPPYEGRLSADGHVDSLQQLIFSDNYFKPWSAEHILTSLLTRSF